MKVNCGTHNLKQRGTFGGVSGLDRGRRRIPGDLREGGVLQLLLVEVDVVFGLLKFYKLSGYKIKMNFKWPTFQASFHSVRKSFCSPR